MGRARALLGSALFLVVAPGTMAGLAPWAISGWRLRAQDPTLRLTGALGIALGLAILVECFARFALQGRGTPAPLAPPDRLVVSGSYRWVRNPMYLAVLALVLGQAALFADGRVFVYGLGFWLVSHAFVVLYEEPSLRRAFPTEFPTYAASVPRWLPRLRPWRPLDSSSNPAARNRNGDT